MQCACISAGPATSEPRSGSLQYYESGPFGRCCNSVTLTCESLLQGEFSARFGAEGNVALVRELTEENELLVTENDRLQARRVSAILNASQASSSRNTGYYVRWAVVVVSVCRTTFPVR